MTWGEPEDTQLFFQHSPCDVGPSGMEINQVRKILLRTTIPSRLQIYTALIVKTKKAGPVIRTSAQTWDFCLSSLLSHTFSPWFCASPLDNCVQVQTTDKSLQNMWTSTEYRQALDISGFLWMGAWIHGFSDKPQKFPCSGWSEKWGHAATWGTREPRAGCRQSPWC